jgi:hypothetical protein
MAILNLELPYETGGENGKIISTVNPLTQPSH